MLSRNNLFFDLADHCTLSCKGCGRYSPHLPPSFPSLENFKKDLSALAQVMRVKTLRLQGGEPLLNKQVTEFVKFAKESGIAELVFIVTNGQLLSRQSEDFFATADRIDVTMYPTDKIDYEKNIGHLYEMQKKYGFFVNVAFTSQFQVINRDTPHDPATTAAIFNSCDLTWSWEAHTFRNGRYYKCPKALFHDRFLADRKIANDGSTLEKEGIAIHEPDLERRLEAFVLDRTPMKACAYCNGTSGGKFAHRQLTQDEKLTINGTCSRSL